MGSVCSNFEPKKSPLHYIMIKKEEPIRINYKITMDQSSIPRINSSKML